MVTLTEQPIVTLARKNLPFCILDDEPDIVELTSERLTKAGFPTMGTSNPQDVLEKIRHGGCRAVLADYKMPGMDGFVFLEKALQCDPGMYVILVTGFYSVDSAIEAIKRGAYDYICQPIDFARLIGSPDELADLFTQKSEIHDLEQRLLTNLQFHGVVGRSTAMLEVLDLWMCMICRRRCRSRSGARPQMEIAGNRCLSMRYAVYIFKRRSICAMKIVCALRRCWASGARVCIAF
jgi:CheY-like chemotaxis protein